jgi:hypothetical protein
MSCLVRKSCFEYGKKDKRALAAWAEAMAFGAPVNGVEDWAFLVGLPLVLGESQ